MTKPEIEAVRKTSKDLDLWTQRLEQTVAELYIELDRLRQDGDCDGSNQRLK